MDVDERKELLDEIGFVCKIAPVNANMLRSIVQRQWDGTFHKLVEYLDIHEVGAGKRFRLLPRSIFDNTSTGYFQGKVVMMSSLEAKCL
jgi:hypothetical protein